MASLPLTLYSLHEPGHPFLLSKLLQPCSPGCGPPSPSRTLVWKPVSQETSQGCLSPQSQGALGTFGDVHTGKVQKALSQSVGHTQQPSTIIPQTSSSPAVCRPGITVTPTSSSCPHDTPWHQEAASVPLSICCHVTGPRVLLNARSLPPHSAFRGVTPLQLPRCPRPLTANLNLFPCLEPRSAMRLQNLGACGSCTRCSPNACPSPSPPHGGRCLKSAPFAPALFRCGPPSPASFFSPYLTSGSLGRVRDRT